MSTDGAVSEGALLAMEGLLCQAITGNPATHATHLHPEARIECALAQREYSAAETLCGDTVDWLLCKAIALQCSH